MYFLVMDHLFFCCYFSAIFLQQFAVGLLAASASRHGGIRSEEWCSSYFLKIFYFIRKYLGGFFCLFCLVLFACILILFLAGERSFLPVHSRAGVWIFLSC